MTQAQYDLPWLNGVNRALIGAANGLSPFYKAHPYRGGLWLSEVDMRVAISHEHRFLYNRLPKNANSTVTALLHAGIGGSGTVDASKHGFARPWKLSSTEVAALEGYYTFCIVRDPYARTLSAYLDKIVRKRRQAKRPQRWLKARFGTDVPSFEQFCIYLDAVGLMDDNHWAPQLDGLVLRPEEFDHIGRFERLGDEIATITTRIFGAPVTAVKRRGPPSTGAAEAREAHYTETATGIVKRLYAKDFEAFGYAP